MSLKVFMKNYFLAQNLKYLKAKRMVNVHSGKKIKPN